MRAFVLGLGSIGRRHARVLARLLGPESVFVSPARTRSVDPEEIGGARVVADRGEISKVAPDFCVIATDTGRHLQNAL